MKYRKKPIVVEAFQYDGNLKGSDGKYYVPKWAERAFKRQEMEFRPFNTRPAELYIKTLLSHDGGMLVSVGDYIIKGVQGELYPCKSDIFEQTYEVVKE